MSIIVFILLIVFLNSIPFFIKFSSPKSEKLIGKLLVIYSILFLTFFLFSYNGFRLKGQFTFNIIAILFISITIFYFLIFKNTIFKVLLTTFVLTPLLVVSVFTLLFGQKLKEFDFDNNKKIIVTNGGFLSCGEIIHITETQFLMFDKEIYYESSLCLQGIEKIEVEKSYNSQIEYLIYHDGKMDSENPYKYEFDIRKE
jgi:ABC-2 type transport system permease protein